MKFMFKDVSELRSSFTCKIQKNHILHFSKCKPGLLTKRATFIYLQTANHSNISNFQ